MLKLYHGLQGGGKTFSMFNDLLEQFKRRPRQVYTNIASAVVPEAVYFCHIEQLLELSDGLVLLDEVGITLPAQFWHEVGRDLLVRICQMRHDGLDLWYTCQRLNGVNVNLREQTNMTVLCSRLGPWIMQRTLSPEGKVSLGSRLVRLRPDVYSLYDTFTNIGRHGGTVANRTGGARSRASQGEAAKRRDRAFRMAPKPSPLLREHLLTRVDPWGPSRLGLDRKSRVVLEWLHDHGHFEPAEHWAGQVRRELRRRAWLAKFSLGPDDAPVTCTPDNPWLAGHDPQTVTERWADYQEEIAVEKAVVLGMKRKGRAAA